MWWLSIDWKCIGSKGCTDFDIENGLVSGPVQDWKWGYT